MFTFILSNNVEEIPTFLDVQTKAIVLDSCAEVASILFKRRSDWEERMMYIPTVAMWEGHEAAFMEYYGVMADQFHQHAKALGDREMHFYAHATIAALQVFNEEIWGESHDPNKPRVKYEITNPFASASPSMIRSHWAELIRQHPEYAKDAPEIDDLSGAPFSYDWA